MKAVVFSLAALAAFSVATANSAIADENPAAALSKDSQTATPWHVSLDGNIFTKEDIASVFVDTAFSTFIKPNVYPSTIPVLSQSCFTVGPSFRDHQGAGLNNPFSRARATVNESGLLVDVPRLCLDEPTFYEEYPWIAEGLFREKGMPRFLAINKWKGRVKISIGYPNDLKPMKDEAPPNNLKATYLNDYGVFATHYRVSKDGKISNIDYIKPDSKAALDEALPLVVSEIKREIPALRDATKLDISYIDHQAETSSDYAHLRVVIVNEPLRWETAVKQDHVVPSGVPHPLLTSHGGPLLPTRNVEFRDLMPSLLSAVRFTPQSEQQVDGFYLPAADNTIGMSFCFVNAKTQPDLMKALVRECLLRSMGLPQAAPTIKPDSVLTLWHDINGFMPENRQQDVLPEITELDRYLLAMLYNDDIKPGLSPNEVGKVILTNH